MPPAPGGPAAPGPGAVRAPGAAGAGAARLAGPPRRRDGGVPGAWQCPAAAPGCPPPPPRASSSAAPLHYLFWASLSLFHRPTRFSLSVVPHGGGETLPSRWVRLTPSLLFPLPREEHKPLWGLPPCPGVSQAAGGGGRAPLWEEQGVPWSAAAPFVESWLRWVGIGRGTVTLRTPPGDRCAIPKHPRPAAGARPRCWARQEPVERSRRGATLPFWPGISG